MIARLGGMLAPWVGLLGRHHHPSLPALVFGGVAVAAGLAALQLPDTSHTNLPYTIEQADALQLRRPHTRPT